jgi:hypothetical protein
MTDETITNNSLMNNAIHDAVMTMEHCQYIVYVIINLIDFVVCAYESVEYSMIYRMEGEKNGRNLVNMVQTSI